jgi:phage terminase large subunit-like protein
LSAHVATSKSAANPRDRPRSAAIWRDRPRHGGAGRNRPELGDDPNILRSQWQMAQNSGLMAITAPTEPPPGEIRTRITRRGPIGPQPWPDKPMAEVTAAEVIAWLREYIPRSELRILAWYAEVIAALYGRRRPLQAIVSIPRGNGKTTFAAALSVFELFARGRRGTQVLQLATAHRQADLCFSRATAMIEASPPLRSRSRERWVGGYKQREVPALGAFMTAVPSQKERTLQGYTPGFTVVDEVGYATEDVWAAMVHGAAKVRGGQVVGIGTPGHDEAGLMWRLRTHARERPERGLYYVEWAAPAGCTITDREAWHAANPALGVVKSTANMAAIVGTSREEDFRSLELGQWVRHGRSWLPWGTWEALPAVAAPPPGAEVVLGFDGSATYDSTALTWASGESVGLVQMWERPGEGSWRVPRTQVLDVIRWAFDRWEVRAIVADPPGWRSELDTLAAEYGDERVVRVPTMSVPHMAPKVDRFEVAALSGQVAHDHNPELGRHLAAANTHHTYQGPMLDKPESGAHIDGAVAAVLAWYGAHELAPLAPPAYSDRLVW